MNTKGINLIAAVQRVCKTLKKKKEQLVAHIPTTISIDLCQGFSGLYFTISEVNRVFKHVQ